MTFERTIGKAAILLVDGNTYLRRLTRSMLLNAGARLIHEAGDGVEALDSIRRIGPDVMLINWHLPALDGFEVVRIVRSPDDFPKPDLPIIMMTEVGSVSRITTALHIGVHEILVKPFAPRTLERQLQSVLMSPRPMVRSEGRYFPAPREGANMDQLLSAAGG